METHYDGFEVIERFNINKNQTCDSLKEWIDAESTLSDFELELLIQVREELNLHGRAWNEEELKINFVGFVFLVVLLLLCWTLPQNTFQANAEHYI
jgi:hypothetical protein